MIVGIYGFQDAGKTTLVESLVAALVKKGYSVASVKHTPHSKSVDSEGKDTWRHWKAGSDPVVFSSRIETTLIKHSQMNVKDITDLVISAFNPDVLIIEGCKEGDFPKVAVGGVKPRKGTVLVNPRLSRLVKYISDEVSVERILEELPGLDCGKCGFDCHGLARLVVEGRRRLGDCKELSNLSVNVVVDGERIAMGRFASSIVDDTVRGMLSSLKGYRPGKTVEIRLEPKRKKSRKRT
jgi:molybdopterin-guanine dinucleotide biosynthesis protein B